VLFGSAPDSLDAQNGAFFCDSSSGALIGDDHPGSVPATPNIFKCEATVAKAVAKLIGARNLPAVSRRVSNGRGWRERALAARRRERRHLPLQPDTMR
jgi:hypothetical protein